jgi:hypothetical protein
MTSEEVGLSLTFCVKLRSAIHPATLLISATKMSPLLYTGGLPVCHLAIARHKSNIPVPYTITTGTKRSHFKITMWNVTTCIVVSEEPVPKCTTSHPGLILILTEVII